MTTADASDVLSTAALASLFVASLSLGAVYAFNYARLGQLWLPGAAVEDTPSPRTHTTRSNVRGENVGETKTGGASGAVGPSGTTTTRKLRRRKKGTGKGVAAEGEDDGDGEDLLPSGGGGGATASLPLVVPGDLTGVGVDVGSSEAGGEPSKPTPGAKTAKKKKQRTKKQKQKQDKHADENQDAGSETDKEVGVRRLVARSGDDSTDASASVSRPMPSVSGSSSRAATRGGVGTSARLAPSSHSREARPSFSFDTDSSWTHVNHRRGKSSMDEDDPRRLTDAMDITSSDVASTASDSPVVGRMESAMRDMYGERARQEQRTLAEKLTSRPEKTGVEDMLERPDVPTLARVMRVQPPADETPVPGFSWEDYGDVVEDSVLVHDADEEDEGEWGVVKSRHRTRHPQTTVTPAPTSHTPSAPEAVTKKQRQNARKRELAKSAKAETEAARLEGLAKHQRELERLRIIEQSQQGGGKKPSGGMHATVDNRGKLVWE